MKSLNIGVVAYGVDPSMVFVRVPNERGRWMLVDRCVVEVDCPYCKAVAGEPCRKVARYGRGLELHDPIRYGVSVHVTRREAWQKATGHRFPAKRAAPHKLRIRAEELGDIQAAAEDQPDIDIKVTPR
ncbi:MAG TPA: hypothetical protein VGK41_01385 [Solirubrobacterales bacterium]